MDGSGSVITDVELSFDNGSTHGKKQIYLDMFIILMHRLIGSICEKQKKTENTQFCAELEI